MAMDGDKEVRDDLVNLDDFMETDTITSTPEDVDGHGGATDINATTIDGEEQTTGQELFLQSEKGKENLHAALPGAGILLDATVIDAPMTVQVVGEVQASTLEDKALLDKPHSETAEIKDEVKSEGAVKKGLKAKGAPHALHWEIFDNDNIRAEKNWETEDAEY